jgi:hypothetical protein
MRCLLHVLASIIALTAASARCPAEIIEFTDKAEWEAAAGPFTTIDFTGFDSMTIITTQYLDLGVEFAGGDDLILPHAGFVNDGWGLAGHESIDMVFTAPMNAVAADFPGGLMIELYWQGDLLYTSSDFGGGGAGWFAGVVSTEPFDSAVFRDWHETSVFTDDLYFGPAIPGAPVIVPFLFTAAITRRRRT